MGLGTDLTNDRFIDRIRRIYGVDVSDLKSGNLADIFDRIASWRDKTPEQP